jgi:general stress protein CsbA
VVLGSHSDPILSEIFLKKRKYSQWIILIDVVSLELVKNDEHEQLQEDLLAEKHEGQPEEEVE